MRTKILIHKLLGTVLIGILLFSCTDYTWDKHYNADASLVSGKNLWETIESEPDLSTFAGLVKKHGYDKLLSQSQAYTVFAPDNNALAGLDTNGMDVEVELIENHIARYFIPASGSEASYIYMLNQKKIEMGENGGNYFFGSAPFASNTIVASNGLVHVLDGYDPFFPNIWEYLAKRSDLDSIKTYLYSFNKIVFNEEASTPGSVVNGQVTYLDSVFINYNTQLMRLGAINDEDSSYTMIVPNNAAWTEAYKRTKNDYVYYKLNQALADSLQESGTKQAIVQDLVFSNTVQVSPQDSMVSTFLNTFYEPQYLFEGSEQVLTSNGSVYITGLLKYKSYESWHKEIIVECERTLGREITLATAFSERAEGDIAVSNGRFLRLSPTTSSGNPTVTFEIPDNLSSTYDIYCVFVPGTINNPDAVGLKPNRIYFNLSYVDTLGDVQISRFPELEAIETDPYIMDTIMVASGFKFPTANYGEEVSTVTLKVVSNVPRSQTTNYSRELLLDCILLEPEKP